MESMGNRLQEIREKRGLTARQLARRADLAAETVLGIEDGTGNPTVKTLEKLASVLECEIGELVQ